jgi:hypothetical protein
MAPTLLKHADDVKRYLTDSGDGGTTLTYAPPPPPPPPLALHTTQGYHPHLQPRVTMAG